MKAEERREVSNRDGKLAIRFAKLAPGRVARVATSTFSPLAASGGGYGLLASPTLSPGQTITAWIQSELTSGNAIAANLYLRYYGAGDKPESVAGPKVSLTAGVEQILTWTVPSIDGQPVFEVGLEIHGRDGASGTVYLDRLTWDGSPDVTLGIPNIPGDMGRRQWVDALDVFRNVYNGTDPHQVFLAINNHGRGLAIHGTRDWTDYCVWATLTPHLAQAAGLAARVRGLGRYYALLLRHPNRAALVKVFDGEETLAEAPFPWRWNDDPHELMLEVRGNAIAGAIDGKRLFAVTDSAGDLPSGGVGLVIEEGRMGSGAVRVGPHSFSHSIH